MANDGAQTEGMPGRYAGALFDLAREQNVAGVVESDLASFQRLLDSSDDLQRFVRSPLIAAELQAKALSAVLAKAGIGGLAANFMGLLARNRRLFAVSDVIKAYMKQAAHARGEVSAEVTSAAPLSDSQRAALEATLKSSTGRTVMLATRVDPALLGGLIVKVGSRMIDSSIRTRINGLRVALKGDA